MSVRWRKVSYKSLIKAYYGNKEEYEKLYTQRYNGENAERFNIKIKENAAFYCLCREIYDLSMDIMELDKKVQLLKNVLPKAALEQFADKCLIDEIYMTNDIEGIFSTRREIKAALNIVEKKSEKKEIRFKSLVNKYHMLGKDEIKLKTCGDIRRIYDELVLAEIAEENSMDIPDGIIFRKDISEVATGAQKIIHSGVYPEKKIIEYMDNALIILNDEKIPFLVRISVFHYLFGYIHPFYDGNGRTSRFISSYLLSCRFDGLIGYRLSYTVKEHISDYYEAFKVCNDPKNKGDLTPFIIMFIKMVKVSFEKLYEALKGRRILLEETVQKLEKTNGFEDKEIFEISKILVQTALFSSDGISKEDLLKYLKISSTTLGKRLKEVESRGFLLTEKIGKYKFYSFDIEKLNI